MAEGGPPEVSVQKSEIAGLLQIPLKKGDTWYLIDAKWFKQWKKYVGFDTWDTGEVGQDSVYPSFIDNGALLKDGGKDLKDHLIEELDYVLLPASAWEKLVTWYKLRDNQEAIARQVIEQGMFVKQCKVEVYLMDLKLARNSELENVKVKQFSRADKIDCIEKEMRLLFNINDDKDVRLWNKYMTNTYEHLDKPENTLQDAGLYQGQMIVIEQKNDDGSWPRQTKTSTVSSHSASTSTSSLSSSYDNKRFTSPSRSGSTSYSTYGSGTSLGTYSSSSSSYNNYDYNGRANATPGLCGLNNLGNTCFMNSAIQCLSNVPQLTEYFLDAKWLDELNEENPLGMRGEIARAYAELIQSIWSGRYMHTVPKNFKLAVSRFAPQFSGYQQHDSQELMAFLLDGLHEDLNRIKQKPYVELKDANGRPDEVVAREAWFNYKKRNDSVITDIFHGLLKSTLVCPQCNKVSITFDPVCYLSLPLPIKKERHIDVVFMPLDPFRKPMQYKLTVPKAGCVGDLCKALNKYTSVNVECMVVVDVYNHRFHRIFTPEEGLTHILDRDDIFIYEIQGAGAEDDQMVLPVYMRERKVRRSSHYTYSHVSAQLFGTPLLVTVPKRHTTYQQLKNIVLHKMARYVRLPQSEEWWMDEKITDDGSEDEKSTDGDRDVDMNQEENEDQQQTTNNQKQDGGDVGGGNNDDQQDKDSSSSGSSSNGPVDKAIFTFAITNSYGSSELDKVIDDDRPIRFTSKSHLAVDWNTKAKKLFFEEKESEMMEVHESMHARPAQKKSIPLNECLDLFTTREKLGVDDPWFCPDCKKHQQATKKFDLWQLPTVLVIHLKRFSYDRYLRDKLDVLVDFPVRDLNMKKWIRNPGHGVCTYDLLGVVNHYGGLGGGHYTAYAKNKDDDKWYHFDDSSVSPASDDQICTKAAYVLVYQRRDVAQAHNQRHVSRDTISGDATVQNGNCSDDEMDTN